MRGALDPDYDIRDLDPVSSVLLIKGTNPQLGLTVRTCYRLGATVIIVQQPLRLKFKFFEALKPNPESSILKPQAQTPKP